MASADFHEAVPYVAYALSCVGRQDLTLKPKQEEALVHLYDGQDIFALFPIGYSKSLC